MKMLKKLMTKFTVGFVALALLSLTSCASLVTPSEPTTFYRLIEGKGSNLQAAKSQALAELQVGVGPIFIPGYVDRPQIVSSGPAGRLIVDDLHHWAEPLQDNIERIMVSNLSTILSDEQVYPYPVNFHPSSDSLQISVEVRDMILTPDGRVLLSASWNVKRMLDNKLVIRQAAKFESHETVSNFEDYSLVLSELFAKLAVQIAASVAKNIS